MTIAHAEHRPSGTLSSLVRSHWPLYAIEGALLGIFMVSACAVTALVEHPASPIRQVIQSALLRRAIIGLAMGATALLLIYNPLGKRSGAHMNPAMTLSFLWLGRIPLIDAVFYIAAQFVGASAGVLIVALTIGMYARHSSVSFAVTTPGTGGPLIAWLAEFAIAFAMMSVVMAVNKSPRRAPFTGCFAAALLVLYITFEAPLSGMSLNPARTLGSAVFAHEWSGLWIYFTAPVAGMFSGIELHRAISSEHHKLCGKLSHSRTVACFIQCDCLEGKPQ
jgi:aquaporin Z